MADETTMTPVEGVEPPKANPLAKPASSSSTLKLKPVERPAAPGAAAPSGLKLPPKPGLATAGLKLPPKTGLAAGLKLPPKPGLATQTGLKLPPKPGFATQTGLKLPPKPGLATQTGLKLPPKSGLAAGLKLPPKPGQPTQTGLKVPLKPAAVPAPSAAAPAAPVAPAGAGPAVVAPAPASVPSPAPVAAEPASAQTASAEPPTVVMKPSAATAGLKIPPKPGLATAGLRVPTKPIIRKPGSTLSMTRPTLAGLKKPTLAGVRKPTLAGAATVPAAPTVPATPAAPAAALTPVTPTEVSSAEKPLEALKSATQHLKSVTSPIPQQAILRKTGMLAEDKSDAQQQAAKSKTSRISLSEAMGAAPVKNENAPMKTIRIKRPIDIPGVTKPESETAAAAPVPDSEASTVVKGTQAPVTDASVSMTQRKTLKISRPSGGVVRPSGKFGIKRPGTMMTAKTAKPTLAKPEGDAAEKPAEGEVADIADIPSIPTAPVPNAPAATEKDVPKGVAIMGLVIQIAACGAMGALAWWLYTDTQILPF